MGPARKLTRSLHSAFFSFQFGVSPHDFEALDGVDDGAEVDVEKLTERHQQNLAIAGIGGDESRAPEVEHKQGRGEPNRQSDFEDDFHKVCSPFVSCIYIIPYLTVKNQRILCKVCVKLRAGPFLNIKLTTIKDGRWGRFRGCFVYW